MKFLSWLITLPITLVFIVFALNNRGNVSVSLWPFSLEVSAPTFVWFYACFFVGIVFGGIIFGGVGTWVSGAFRRTPKPQKPQKPSSLIPSLRAKSLGEHSEKGVSEVVEKNADEQKTVKPDMIETSFGNKKPSKLQDV